MIEVVEDVDQYGVQRWHIKGTDILHKEDGPAVIAPGQFISYYINGNEHRDDGPSLIWEDGFQGWSKHGKIHRTDGPALLDPNWGASWFIEDKEIFSRKLYQELTGLSDEDMSMLVLKYGGFLDP